MNIKKHKVFISYYHFQDKEYKEKLIQLGTKYGIFDDYSIRINAINDTGKSTDEVAKIIRDKYMKNATVLILLCGKKTKKRKFVDRELHAAMYHTDKNPRMGIVVINLPEIEQWIRASGDEEQRLMGTDGEWKSLSGYQEYKQAFPYMPERIMDNLVKDVPISVVDWSMVSQNPTMLKQLIHNAFIRRKSI